MIHCALAHQGVWAGVAKSLSKTHTITAFDMPGHGRSADWDGQGDYQQLTTRIAETFCDDGPVHLIGHSFGGTVALRLACERPNLVNRLSLIEPVFFAAARAAGDPAYARNERDFAPFAAAMQAGDRATAARLFMSMWGGGTPWAALPDAQRTYITDRIHLIPAQGKAIRDDNANLLTSGLIEALTMPIDLIDGALSGPIMPAILNALSARMQNPTRTTIDGAGHMVPITHPTQIAEILAT
nr:alpha/beta hydrolase [Sulfitobacter algicola]